MTRLSLSSFIFHLPQTNAQKFCIPKNWSSLTKVLSFFSIIFEAINCGKIHDVVYINLRKAFDTVPHKLLFILRNVGLTGSLWKWFKGYHFDRYHFVSVVGGSSVCLKILIVIYSIYQ